MRMQPVSPEWLGDPRLAYTPNLLAEHSGLSLSVIQDAILTGRLGAVKRRGRVFIPGKAALKFLAEFLAEGEYRGPDLSAETQHEREAAA